MIHFENNPLLSEVYLLVLRLSSSLGVLCLRTALVAVQEVWIPLLGLAENMVHLLNLVSNSLLHFKISIFNIKCCIEFYYVEYYPNLLYY
jgi:hypothetical protein